MSVDILLKIKKECKSLKVFFKDNLWGADLADIQLISKYNKGLQFLLYVIVNLSKYAWGKKYYKDKKRQKNPEKQDKDKDKESITITNVFQKILDERNGKPNTIWIDKGSEFYYRSMILWLQDNDIEMCSTQNERKSAVVERFIGNLKNKTYKYMTPISKIVYIDKYDDVVNKYNNKHNRAIKIKPVDVKFNTSIEFGAENNEKILNLKLWPWENIEI